MALDKAEKKKISKRQRKKVRRVASGRGLGKGMERGSPYQKGLTEEEKNAGVIRPGTRGACRWEGGD